jgi:glycosyltransferase involved in cell wall biosynthesis
MQFFHRLKESGFIASHVVASGHPRSYFNTLRQAAVADIVVVLRKTFPTPYLWLLRKLSRKLVFDFDDAIFCNTDGTPSATRMQRFAAMASVCDYVFAGNHFLAEQVVRHNPAVTVIPTCIDMQRYAVDLPKPTDSIDLVWIGSSSTRKYLVEVLPALRLAASRVPGLRLKIIADFDLPGAGLPTLAIPWSAETEAQALSASHIGIAPMRDDDWSRGKCALKVLQYMAAGLPVVSSHAGANAEVVLDGQTGFLVRDDASWGMHIAILANDAALRARLGATGRRRAIDNYSTESVFSRMSNVLKSLA